METLVHTPEGSLTTEESDKVFVVLKTYIVPEIRIDQGGGEIGYTDILGVYSSKVLAQVARNIDYNRCANEVEKDFGYNDEEVNDYMEYSYRYDLRECVLDSRRDV